MVRVKLSLLIVFTIGALVALGSVMTDNLSSDLEVSAIDQLNASNDVVRLADTVVDYSLMFEASEVSRLDGLVEAVGCPANDAALAEARRLVPDPDFEMPAGGLRAGEAVPMVPGTDCTRTSHAAALDLLKAWNDSREALRSANQDQFLPDRAPGQALPRNPDILVVSDAEGTVIARVGFDLDDWFGPSRPNMAQSYPVVARAELGIPQADIVVWREDESANPSMAQVGVAPILKGSGDDIEIIGAVTLGYFLTNDAAAEASDTLVGVDVAYYFRGDGNNVSYAGTTVGDPQFLGSLQSAEFFRRTADGQATGDAVGFADVTLSGSGSFYEFEHRGDRYLTTGTTLSRDQAGTQVQSGFLVVMSLSSAIAPATSRAMWLPGLGGALLLISIFGMLIGLKQHEAPLQEISRGVQEVIAGNRDFMWEVNEKSHMSDLAHSLNIMSARLQGKRDPDSDDVEGADEWAAMAGGGGGAAKAQRPAGIGGLGGLRGRAASDDDGEDDE